MAVGSADRSKVGDGSMQRFETGRFERDHVLRREGSALT